MSDSKRLDFLEALRGISIIPIIFFHCGSSSLGGIWSQAGNLFTTGLSMFLVISGLLTFSSLERLKEKNGSIKGWYLNKYFRLFPLYYLAIIVAMVAKTYNPYWLGTENGVTVGNIITHVLFLHDLFPHYSNSILSVEWYLGALVVYYAFSPLLFKFIDSFEKSIIAMVVTLLAIPPVNLLLFKVFPVASDPMIYEAYKTSIGPVNSFPAFMMGIVLFFAVDKLGSRKIGYRKLLSVSLLLISAFLIWGQVVGANSLYHMSTMTMNGIWCSLVIISLCICDNVVIDNPVFRFIGRYSYAMYLYHMIFVLLYNRYVGAERYILLKFLLTVVVMLVVGALLTEFVDKPIQKRLRGIAG